MMTSNSHYSMSTTKVGPPPFSTTTTPPPQPTSPKIILGKYQLGRVLGRGNFAKVHHAKSIITGLGVDKSTSSVAIKVIEKSKTNPKLETLIVREVEAMRRLDHPHVLKIYEVMATKTKIYLVMELAKGGDLFSNLARRPDRRLPEPLARRYFHQLVAALRFCHQHGVSHRDIKPHNLLLDHMGDVKVADFGLSSVVDPTLRENVVLETACGTPAFTAPEIVGRSRAGYDGPKADAWSCGVMLFMLLCGHLPFDDSNIPLMYKKMHKREFRFPSWVSRAARSLIIKMLDPNPRTRVGIEQVMEEPWLKNQGIFHCRSVSLGDIASTEEKRVLSTSLNAFEIIAMSSGLDLSGIFDETMCRMRRDKMFTSTEPKGVVVEKVVDVGKKLGFEIEKREKGLSSSSGSSCVVLGKGRLVLKVLVREVALELVVVEIKEVSESGIIWEQEEEIYWGEFISSLAHIANSWHR